MHAFDIHVPHTELVVTGTTVVETSVPAPERDDVGCEELAGTRCYHGGPEALAVRGELTRRA